MVGLAPRAGLAEVAPLAVAAPATVAMGPLLAAAQRALHLSTVSSLAVVEPRLRASP